MAEGGLVSDLLGNRLAVLVVGVYLPNAPTNAVGVVRELQRASRHEVAQRWYAAGGPVIPELAGLTLDGCLELEPQYIVRNALMRGVDLTAYDYVIHVEDDMILPNGFLDSFLEVQKQCDFAVAQAARTIDSFTDHRFVLQQVGVKARRTQFVEGPVLSFRRDSFGFVFPFDETNPNGFGYSQVWAYEANRLGLSLGIVDSVPVRHTIRRQGSAYGERRLSDARRDKANYLSRHRHLPMHEAQTTRETYWL